MLGRGDPKRHDWGARIRTWDRGTKTRCLTTWPRPMAVPSLGASRSRPPSQHRYRLQLQAAAARGGRSHPSRRTEGTSGDRHIPSASRRSGVPAPCGVSRAGSRARSVSDPGDPGPEQSHEPGDAPVAIEPRWPVALAVSVFLVVTIVLRALLPNRETLRPAW